MKQQEHIDFYRKEFFNHECNFRTNFLGGGYRYSLKCVEQGEILTASTKSFSSTYGGELCLYSTTFPLALAVDGVNIDNQMARYSLISTATSNGLAFRIPFSASVVVTAPAAQSEYYVLYTYQRIAETT